ncbi:hypothetical protein BGZ46_003759 [Entomortierella lignicola]|nr:hypothetical protein BGZ46_003759 [Entomortierella lignicola]
MTEASAPIITTATTAEVATTPSSQAPVTISTPPITTLETTPAITTISNNDPPTRTAITTTSVITEPSMTTVTTTPYTTHYITTISLVTITTFVPQTTVISGKATTIYSTEITVSSVPTIIPDPSQPPPPLTLYHGGGPLPWQIALISVASSILVAGCISLIIFVRTRRRRNKDKHDTDLMSVGIETWSDPNKNMMVVGSSRGGCGEAEAVIPIGNGSNNGGGVAGGGEYWSEYDGATGLVTTDEYSDNHHRYQYHHQHIPREPKMQSSGGAMEFYHNYDEDQYHHYRGYQAHTYTHDNNNVNNSSYNNYESYSNRDSTVQQQQQQEEKKDYHPASYRDDYGASLARQQQQQQYLPVNYPRPPLLPTTNSFSDDMNHGSASPSLTVVSQNTRELYAQLPKDDQKGRYSEISSSVGGGNIMIRDLDLETSSGEMNAKFELYRKSPQALIVESKGTQEEQEQEQELQEQKDHQQQQQHLERLLETT